MEGNVIYVKYVKWENVVAYETVGWQPKYGTFDRTHHGDYSVAMEWKPSQPDEQPPVPNLEQCGELFSNAE